MSENSEKIFNARVKNIVHLIRLTPNQDQEELIERFTKGEPDELKAHVRNELSKFEMEFVNIIHSPEISSENEEQAKIVHFKDKSTEGEENGIFITITSWDNTKKHKEFNKLIGKKIKVIIRELKN
jgi:hypothetical protein